MLDETFPGRATRYARDFSLISSYVVGKGPIEHTEVGIAKGNMGSLYLSRLDKDARSKLERQLWEQQGGKCFISEKPIDLALEEVDIDHIIPTRDAGKDDPSNFAITLAHFNRSKQAADLRVARVLARFERIKAAADSDDRGPNLNDVLKDFSGASSELRMKIDNGTVTYLTNGGAPTTVPLHDDKLSGFRYFFAVLPIEVVRHDERINPRSIGANVRGLVEEFFKKRPQLHVALGYVNTATLPTTTVRIFDGQHKAAAQILLGVRNVPLRVFVDPNEELLLTANTNAGTTLRQVAFDKSVQRRLGSSILVDKIEIYRTDKNLDLEDDNFSEKDLVEHFKGEQRAIARYVLDSVRDSITHSPKNKLRDFVEYAGKGYEKPFSYSSIEKTFYSKFIYPKMLETRWDHRSEMGENPRELEKEQLIRLMSLIAEKIYIGKYDDEIGTRRLENKVQNGEDVPEPHLRAFRMAKEEILYTWLAFLGAVIEQHFLFAGTPRDKAKLFQYPFPEQLWSNIGIFLDNLSRLPLWVDRPASSTVFGGKQTYSFWQSIFETGSSTSGHKVLPAGLNIAEMIKA